MRLLHVLTSSCTAVLLTSLTAACGSDAGSDSDGMGGATTSQDDDDPKTQQQDLAGMAGGSSVDEAPGELDIELTVEADQHTFSWTLPADDDLVSLRMIVLPASDETPEPLDADEMDLEDGSVLLANFKTGTAYVAYFFLVDQAGQTTMTTYPFMTDGPAPIGDVFALGMRGAVYLRWQEPAANVKTVFIREGQEFIPSTVSEGELAYSGTGSRFLQQSLSSETEYGYLLYAVDTKENPSTFEFVQVSTVDEFTIVNDAVSECETYGYKVFPTPKNQTFVRGSAGEDVLVGLELEITKTGTPADNLRVQVLDENDEYLWSSSIAQDKIPSGTNWIRLSADGQGIKGVPYELLDPGQTYTIAVWTDTVDDAGSYTWKSSTGDCYPAGEGVGGRDFHFRTLHASAE